MAQMDSLISKHTDKKGEVAIKSVLDEGKNYVVSHPTEVFQLIQKVSKIAENQKDDLSKAQTYQFLGALHFQVKANYDSSSIYLKKAENLFEKLKSKPASEGLAMVYHNFGTLKQVQGDYAESITYYIQALRLFEQTENMELFAFTLNNVSTMYALAKDFLKAEAYARKCIEVSKKTGNAYMEATGKIALVDALLHKKSYQAIPTLLNEIQQYGKTHEDPYKTFLYHLNYAVYLKDYKKNIPLAVQELEKGYKMVASTEDEWEIMRYNSALAEIYLADGQFEKAYLFAKKTLETAEKLDTKDKIAIAYSVLAQVYAHRQEYEIAYRHLDSASHYKDLLYNENNHRQIAFLETMYQTEKKELKIQSLEEQRRRYIWMGISIAGILLMALAFAFTRYRLAESRRKLIEKENLRLEQEKQLSATNALLQGQEDERSRMAKELHDGIGGLLSGVKLNLNNMHKKLIITEEDGAAFEKSIHLLDESINELRRVAHNLMPESIVKFGLDGAIAEFLQSIQNENLRIIYQSYHIENGLGKQLDISIYRMIQELVHNAIKHSGASEILVQVRKDENLVILDVEDNGKGFDVNSNEKEKGMGLAGIRSRVAYWKGNMKIDSENSGTAVHIEIPV